MKAISVRQPWAWALCHGKKVENRDWRYLPKYRGPILIHASLTFDIDGWQWLDKHQELLDASLPLPGGKFKQGGFVGWGYLTEVIKDIDICQGEYHESPWFFGPMGLVIPDCEEIQFIRYPGKLGIFNVPDSVLVDS